MDDKPTRKELEARIQELERLVNDMGNQLDRHNPPCAVCGQEDSLGSLKLQTILDNIPNPVWLKDGKHRFMVVNRAFTEVSGLEPEAHMGKTDADIWPEDFSSGYMDSDQEVFETGRPIRMEEKVLHNTLGVRIHDTFKTPIYDNTGAIVGTTGIGHDITRLRRTKERLIQTNELLEEVQRLSKTGGWEFDVFKRRAYWTDNHFRLYGYEPGETSSLFRFFLLKVVHPEDTHHVRACFRQAMQTGQRVDMNYRAVCKSGEVRNFTSTILADRRNDGYLSRLYGVAQDVTTYTRNQEQMRDAKEQADAAYRAKSEFLANMSHEIRTPLNGVLGMLQLLNQANLGEEHDKSVQVALDSGQGLLTIINDVLNLSKLEAGKAELHNRPFSPRKLVQSLERLFLFPAAQNGTVLRFEVDERVPLRLDGDKERLRQILFNLLGNAIKFTEEGEIRLSMSLLPARPRPDHLQFLVTVGDTGIGIPDNKVDFVLDPFSQVDGSLTRKYQGSGLGMHIVRRTVDLMKGSMSIDTELGTGTNVYLSLPFRQTTTRDVTKTKRPQPPSRPPGEGLKVLVVEDERINRITAKRFLDKLGHHPTLVKSGENALTALKMDSYDVILMDIQMPEMDGLETTNIIRAAPDLKKHRSVPIIALTAYAMEGDREKFLAAGVDGYLAKPVNLEALRKVLAAYS